MTVLLFNFLIAVAVTLAACAVIAFILTNLVIGCSKGADTVHAVRNFWSKSERHPVRCVGCFERFSCRRNSKVSLQ